MQRRHSARHLLWRSGVAAVSQAMMLSGVYRAGCRVAVVDHVFTQNERRMLDHLRGLLGIPEDIAQELEAEIPGLVAI